MLRTPSRALRALALLSLVTALAASDALAQSRLCATPRPLPRCGAYLVTELSAGYSLIRETFTDTLHYPAFISGRDTFPAGSNVITDQSASGSLTWDLGAMYNLGRARSVGASVFAAYAVGEGDGTRYGLRGRYRWWLDDRRALEIAPAVMNVETRVKNSFEREWKAGASISAAATLFPVLSAIATVERIPDGTRAQVGARLEGPPGLYTGLALPVVVFLAVLMSGD